VVTDVCFFFIFDHGQTPTEMIGSGTEYVQETNKKFA
jgi:hypothetical protein